MRKTASSCTASAWPEATPLFWPGFRRPFLNTLHDAWDKLRNACCRSCAGAACVLFKA